MKKIFLFILGIYLLPISTYAQRNCGFESTRTALIAKDPAWARKLDAQRASLQGIADNYKLQAAMPGAKKTTAASAIPVIFHFMVTNAQLAQIGGVAGVAQRVDSQIAVLNRDFNRENPDSVLIPTGWKHLYASVGIRFGLAHTDPSGYGTPGYDILILPDLPGGFSGTSTNYSNAKHAGTGGVDAWDVTKYMNIWCTNFTDYPGLLGLTTYKSITGGGGFPADEEGMCMNYAAIGKRALPTDYYIPTGYGGDHYDMGRTLTHELGHFFEIWHTWGDDGGLCPWNGGKDDGLADTPPEGDAKFYNLPDTIPGGTYYDQCRYDGVDTQLILYGIASHDYMNYTDDISMFMFTRDQAAVMYAMVSDTGESFSLTQNPDLLNWSVKTAVAGVKAGYSLCMFPNPTTGRLFITFDKTADELQQISVTDVLGNELQKTISTGQQNEYSIDLAGMSKGIYIVRCNFASGSITRKILLQ